MDNRAETSVATMDMPAGFGIKRIPMSWLFRASLLTVAVGVLWRLARYALQFPISCDEAYLCVNFLDQDYVGLTGPLKRLQVAPLLFLWSEFTIHRFFGGWEVGLRLIPLLAGLASLALFWRMAWRILPPSTATVAVSLLAVSYWPAGMSCMTKPYSLDLFFTLALLVPAIEWYKQPDRWSWLALLTFICPVATFSSFPIPFVAGAVSVGLLPTIWSRSDWTTRVWFVLFNVGMIAAFLANYLLVGLNQIQGGDGVVGNFMTNYWVEGFPPFSIWEFPTWFYLIHAGRMFAYPIGDANGGSIVTTVIAAIGLVTLVRTPRLRGLALLLLTPFVLNFIAAVIRKYPYGGCCRLSQHVAPSICILVALGIITIVRRINHTSFARRRAIIGICIAMMAIGIGGIVRDFVKPYRETATNEASKFLSELFKQVQVGDRVIVVQDSSQVDPVTRWFLAKREPQIEWNTLSDVNLVGTRGDVWLLRYYEGGSPPEAFSQTAPTRLTRPTGIDPETVHDPLQHAQRLVMSCVATRWTIQNNVWTQDPKVLRLVVDPNQR